MCIQCIILMCITFFLHCMFWFYEEYKYTFICAISTCKQLKTLHVKWYFFLFVLTAEEPSNRSCSSEEKNIRAECTFQNTVQVKLLEALIHGHKMILHNEMHILLSRRNPRFPSRYKYFSEDVHALLYFDPYEF